MLVVILLHLLSQLVLAITLGEGVAGASFDLKLCIAFGVSALLLGLFSWVNGSLRLFTQGQVGKRTLFAGLALFMLNGIIQYFCFPVNDYTSIFYPLTLLFLGPLVEEMVRALSVPLLEKTGMKHYYIILIMGVIFSAYHLPHSFGYAVSMVFLGGLLTWLYLKERNLISLVLAHAAWNLPTILIGL
ncbi:CPBP family intramembrane glutamic endopeptidase [Persicobacter sp. CCB-QB2]|uniref:CPBP family intramembrane glutamic endopeptidase n=1 Tax=Persicobacter sp. CCB-QB2 TaxID=1561025 RepID=UPI0012F989FD|nr:CPBP family intramembrane glutamic endopeptidase [Persicobacter sp. CCB-QB2]